MYGFFDDAVNIYLILELAMGGQLFKQLKKLQSMAEARVATIMRQVCQAVNELHANQIIHRDIKPENIVLHEVNNKSNLECYKTLRFWVVCLL